MYTSYVQIGGACRVDMTHIHEYKRTWSSTPSPPLDIFGIVCKYCKISFSTLYIHVVTTKFSCCMSRAQRKKESLCCGNCHIKTTNSFDWKHTEKDEWNRDLCMEKRVWAKYQTYRYKSIIIFIYMFVVLLSILWIGLYTAFLFGSPASCTADELQPNWYKRKQNARGSMLSPLNHIEIYSLNIFTCNSFLAL